jgi:hypothetical protein
VQALFLELRKIEKLEEENAFEVNWLMELLREVMVYMFISVSKNKDINATAEESISLQTDEAEQVSDFPLICTMPYKVHVAKSFVANFHDFYISKVILNSSFIIFIP